MKEILSEYKLHIIKDSFCFGKYKKIIPNLGYLAPWCSVYHYGTTLFNKV